MNELKQLLWAAVFAGLAAVMVVPYFYVQCGWWTIPFCW